MLLQEKLDAFTDGLLKSGAIPNDVVEILFKATSDLVASKEAEKALKAGQPAPSFRLSNSCATLSAAITAMRSAPITLPALRISFIFASR